MRKITNALAALARDGAKLERLADADRDSAEERDLLRLQARWLRDADQVLRFARLDHYAEQIHRIHDFSYGVRIAAGDAAQITGVLQSAHKMFTGGFVGQLRHALHVEMFDSVLAQAEGLCVEGHFVPAAVLTRIIIERWLRDMAQRAGIKDCEKLNASQMNDALKKAERVSKHKWRTIQAKLDVGNAAAHGDMVAVSEADVKEMIQFAKLTCADPTTL